MKAISYAFFVTAAEYPRLQAACPGDFPFTYAQFCARVDQSIRDTADTVAVEKVYVSVDKFLAWCAARSLGTEFLGATPSMITDHALKRIFHMKAWLVLTPVLGRARALNARTPWYYRGVFTERFLALRQVPTSPSNLRTYTC